MSKTNLKISLFSIAFALGLNITGVAPVLGLLSETFEGEGANAIQTLQTIPNLSLMVASILVGWLATKISKKKLVLGGLLLVAFIGSSPFIVNSFSFIMTSRLLAGFGFGIISPLNVAIISEFSQGRERASMMGLQVSGMGIGAICTNIVGGMLGKIGYQQFFLIHLISIITFLIVLTQLPDTGVAVSGGTKKLKLNKKVYELSFTSFFNALFLTAFGTNIGLHIAENLHGDTVITGFATAVNAGCTLLVGMNFSKISSSLKQYTLPLAILTSSLGYLLLILLPTSRVGILVASACCGVSISCFMAESSYRISTSVNQVAIAIASGFFALFGGIGGLISPIVLNGTSKLAFGSVSTTAVFLICTIGTIILALVSYRLMLTRQKEVSLNHLIENKEVNV
jgi:predicted MFS family arabinose efflux permease